MKRIGGFVNETQPSYILHTCMDKRQIVFYGSLCVFFPFSKQKFEKKQDDETTDFSGFNISVNGN